jgi:hypothetical protein
MSPESGLTYGLIVSHDPSILMTYIVPMSIVLEFVTIEAGSDVSFSPELSPEQAVRGTQGAMNSQGPDTVKKSADQGRRSITNRGGLSALDIFLSQIERYTLRNVFGIKFVLTRQLTDWLVSSSDGGDGVLVSQVERLLDFVYPDEMALPVIPDELSREGSSFLLVFSLLLELRQGHLIDVFRRFDLNDNRLPLLSLDQLPASLRGHRLANMRLEDFTQRFLQLQWAYCPIRFDDQMAASLAPECVLPIIQRQRINSKGATAAIWEVTVPEELVGSRLQHLTKYDRFENASDDHGLVSSLVLLESSAALA